MKQPTTGERRVCEQLDYDLDTLRTGARTGALRKLVAAIDAAIAAEREACAKVADEQPLTGIAAAIRARGTQPRSDSGQAG